MAKSAEQSLGVALKETLADLAYFPGRGATAWRVALVCTLVTALAMMFKIPESAISLYLVIYLMKDDGALNTILGAVAIIGVAILVALMIPILQWTVESTLLRIVVMSLVSFIFIYIGAATKLGEGGSIVALIIAFILGLVNLVPVDGVISLALRYAGEMAILPLFCISLVSLFAGRWSKQLLKEELAERLKLALAVLDHLPDSSKPDSSKTEAAEDAEMQAEQLGMSIGQSAHTKDKQHPFVKLQKKLESGNDDQAQKLMLVKLLRQATPKKTAQIERDIAASYQLLLGLAAVPIARLQLMRDYLKEQITKLSAALDRNENIPSLDTTHPEIMTQEGKGIYQALGNLLQAEKIDYEKNSNSQFVAPDIKTNPVYQRFALKTTLAAISCYIFYTALDWQGIETAMVTCYVASMGTAGDSVHKLALRISGALIGAAIGVGSILFLFPHMASIGSLLLLVFFVTLLSAWIAAGSEKISYGGVQVALAFALTVLQGFGPSTSMDPASDRIIGILVGNVAVYLVSTLIWPTPVNQSIKNKIAEACRNIAKLAVLEPEKRLKKVASAADIEKLMGDAKYSLYLLPFEPNSLRPDHSRYLFYKNIVEDILNLNKAVYFSQRNIPEAVEQLEGLSQYLSGSVISNERLEEFRAELLRLTKLAQNHYEDGLVAGHSK